MGKTTITFPGRGRYAPDITGPLSEQEQYVKDCLAGKRFPNANDRALLGRCKQEWQIREWIELYKHLHVVPNLRSHEALLCRLRKHFGPLEDLYPEDVTRPVVVQWFEDLGATYQTVANNCLKTLSGIFSKLAEWQIWTEANPCVGIKKFKKTARERFVQPGEEMQRLLGSLALEPNDVQAFFLTCLLTGARKGEVSHMKWEDLNFTTKVWHKPTTKNGKPHAAPLPLALAERLQGLPRLSAHVFDGPHNPDGRWKDGFTYHVWHRIRHRAHLPEVTIHDLRRTCASWLAMHGASAVMIAKALGHTTLQHVHIYARLDTQSQRTALDAQADRIMGPVPAPVSEPVQPSGQMVKEALAGLTPEDLAMATTGKKRKEKISKKHTFLPLDREVYQTEWPG
jgi:integrase